MRRKTNKCLLRKETEFFSFFFSNYFHVNQVKTHKNICKAYNHVLEEQRHGGLIVKPLYACVLSGHVIQCILMCLIKNLS